MADMTYGCADHQYGGCPNCERASGVQGASAPRYAVRWSTGGYIVYEKDGGRTLTPEEVERALGVPGVGANTVPHHTPMVGKDEQ